MVVGFPVSCAAAVAAERGCRSAREVRCIVVAAAVRTKKMVLRRLLDGSRSPAWRCRFVAAGARWFKRRWRHCCSCDEDGSCANGGPWCGGATKLRRRWSRWWRVAVAAVMEVAGAVAGENEEVRWWLPWLVAAAVWRVVMVAEIRIRVSWVRWRRWWRGKIWLVNLVNGGLWHVSTYGWPDLKGGDCHMAWSGWVEFKW